MYYKEYLRARKSLAIFILVATCLLGISLLISMGGPVVVNIGDDQKAAHDAARAAAHVTVGIPWLEFFGAAALIAAVMSTVLGSTLAQENDGHLELACTKPVSRTRYVATAMGIDITAVVLTQLVAFAFILIPIYLFGHRTIHLVQGHDAGVNALRLALFPIAWYAVIVGLSAGTRGKAGIVQGLIWPITLALVALREAPFSSAWHSVFLALNAVNPLIYASYKSGDVNIIGATPLNVLTSTVMLGVFVVAGWAAATLQWRRVEA